MPTRKGGAVFAKHIAASTASLDPYEEPDPDEADRAKIQEWLQHVDAELSGNRSPFIAAEILLKEMETVSGTVNDPLKLYLATAFPVFKRCLPFLTEDYRDVVAAALHELMPAIYFTRTTERVDGAGEITNRVSYAECFWRVHRLLQGHERNIEEDGRRLAIEESVMDHLVVTLDRLWVKMCFLSWRVYTRKLREKKLLFRKLVHRGLVGQIVPRYIRSWRQHSHAVMLKAKIAKSNALAKELEELYPQEQDAKSRFERAQEEVREKIRLLEEANSDNEQMRARMAVLESLLSETEESLRSHWLTWRMCVAELFRDSNPIDSSVEADSLNIVTYLQNITDTAALYSNRAAYQGAKIGIGQIAKLLSSKDMLVVTQRASTQAPSKGTAAVSKYVPPPDPSPSVEDVIWSLARACYPVVSPLRINEIKHFNEDHLVVVLRFISSMFSGGHGSLFVTPPSLKLLENGAIVEEEPPNEFDSTLEGKPASESAVENTVSRVMYEPAPVKDAGSRMVEHVALGMQIYPQCSQGADRYMMAIKRSLETNNVEIIHSYLGNFFKTWSCLGIPMDREKIESVTAPLVKEADLPVLQAFYPVKGISTFTELVQYLTSVSEFSRLPLISIAERLEAFYPCDANDAKYFALASEEIAQYFQKNTDHMNRLLEHLKDAENGKGLSEEATMKLLTKQLRMPEENAICVWRETGADAELVASDELDELLYMAAQYRNPSPFSTTVEKISETLDACVRFLLDLE